MSNGIGFKLVDRGIQRNDVDVMDLLISGDVMLQFGGTGSSTLEGILDIQWTLQLQTFDKRNNIRTFFLLTLH